MRLDPVFRQMIARFRRSQNWDGDLDLALLQSLWPTLVGSNLASAARVVAVQGSRVVINVPDLIWRKQLVAMKKLLLSKLNEPWAVPWITEIVFTHEDYRE